MRVGISPYLFINRQPLLKRQGLVYTVQTCHSSLPAALAFILQACNQVRDRPRITTFGEGIHCRFPQKLFIQQHDYGLYWHPASGFPQRFQSGIAEPDVILRISQGIDKRIYNLIPPYLPKGLCGRRSDVIITIPEGINQRRDRRLVSYLSQDVCCKLPYIFVNILQYLYQIWNCRPPYPHQNRGSGVSHPCIVFGPEGPYKGRNKTLLPCKTLQYFFSGLPDSPALISKRRNKK